MMWRKARTTSILAALLCLGLAYGQTGDSHLAFEVASVKPSLSPGPNRSLARQVRGGPGSTGPGAATFTNIDLFSLVTMAYDIKAYQLSGPGWLGTTLFDITAKIPPGTTREQYRLMLQNLLAERFKLAVHRDRKDAQVFDLVVAKGGPKLKESAEDPSAADDGSLQPPPPAPRPPVGYNGPVTLQLNQCPMERFVDRLSGLVGQSVGNATGLNGKYDIRLLYSLAGLQAGSGSETPSATSAPPTIFDALQEQLGLKLVQKKGSTELLVIDHIEKVPTGN